jgi:hypothetical protein
LGQSFRQARLHYAWIVAGVTFLVLLVTAGIFATPGVLMVPLEAEFGWTSAAISTAIAINLALFGLIGPFAASLMDRWGLRRLVLCALLLLAASVGLTTVMKSQWQLVLLWGVCVGSGNRLVINARSRCRLHTLLGGPLQSTNCMLPMKPRHLDELVEDHLLLGPLGRVVPPCYCLDQFSSGCQTQLPPASVARHVESRRVTYS